MADIDVTKLDVPQLVAYARSLGISTHGMNRQEMEDEIASATKKVIPEQGNPRLDTLESIIAAISPVLEQLQTDVKQLQFVTGLTTPEKDKENEDARC